ncbi:MAG: hypothetical protein II278_00540 [Bacteroidaceae bacterium]|nr:hypothetical protein [Bacteroidaceae bacterium]
MIFRVSVVAHEYGAVAIEADSKDEAIEAANYADLNGAISWHTREIDVIEVEVEEDCDLEEED